MATTQDRPNLKPRPRIAAGFRMLTLTPSPRLREHRRRLASRNYTSEAWTEVGRAISRSAAAVATSIRASHNGRR